MAARDPTPFIKCLKCGHKYDQHVRVSFELHCGHMFCMWCIKEHMKDNRRAVSGRSIVCFDCKKDNLMGLDGFLRANRVIQAQVVSDDEGDEDKDVVSFDVDVVRAEKDKPNAPCVNHSDVPATHFLSFTRTLLCKECAATVKTFKGVKPIEQFNDPKESVVGAPLSEGTPAPETYADTCPCRSTQVERRGCEDCRRNYCAVCRPPAHSHIDTHHGGGHAYCEPFAVCDAHPDRQATFIKYDKHARSFAVRFICDECQRSDRTSFEPISPGYVNYLNHYADVWRQKVNAYQQPWFH